MKDKTKATIEQVRKIQLNILDEIDDYCSNNELKYFLIAGTLLGAVRHKGYIPWDDDIDLCMLRKDYENFISQYKSKYCYVVCSDNTDGYNLPFAKVCRKGTIAIEQPYVLKCTIGINIDIFPIDYLPNEEASQQLLLNKINKYRYQLGIKWGIPSQRSGFFAKIYRRLMRLVLLPISEKSINRKINDEASTYLNQSTDYAGEIVWGCGLKEVVHTSVFEEVCLLPFEGKKYCAPVGWKEWLSNRYGDFMKMPPLEQQVAHHNRVDYITDEYLEDSLNEK